MTTPPARKNLHLPNIALPYNRGTDNSMVPRSPSSTPPTPRMPSIVRVVPRATSSPSPHFDQTHMSSPIPFSQSPLQDITSNYDEFLQKIYQKMFDEVTNSYATLNQKNLEFASVLGKAKEDLQVFQQSSNVGSRNKRIERYTFYVIGSNNHYKTINGAQLFLKQESNNFYSAPKNDDVKKDTPFLDELERLTELDAQANPLRRSASCVNPYNEARA